MKGLRRAVCTPLIILKKAVVFVALFPVYLYRIAVSPFFSTCKYYPTCSKYMLESVSRFGVIKGYWLGCLRILRCHPFRKSSGYDPVPYRYRGGAKWVI